MAHLQNLVDLLLILGDEKLRVGGLGEHDELLTDGVLVDTERDRAQHLRRELREHPLGPIVPDDRDDVATDDTESSQT